MLKKGVDGVKLNWLVKLYALLRLRCGNSFALYEIYIHIYSAKGG